MKQRLLFGTAGWSYKDWEGVVYPPDAGKDFKPLRYISDFFDCVEINSTFYRIPARRMSLSLLALVSHRPSFMFSVKLFREFTHTRGTALDGEKVSEFMKGVEPLVEAGRFGALLIQFPWSFRFDEGNRAWVAQLAKAFREVPRILEVRHISWGAEEAFTFMKENDLGFCNIDQPYSKTSIPPMSVLTGKVGYVRLHGRNAENWFKKDAGRDERYDYYYSAGELDAWVERIRQMAAKADTVFVITNNHYRGQAPANALQLMSRLLGEKVAVPEPLLEHFPELKEIRK